jgi:tetratricopeptide (TPR) repeat protein
MDHPQETPVQKPRFWSRVLAGAAILLVMAASLFFFGVPVVKQWQSDRMLEKSRLAYEAGELRQAFLACQAACLKNPDNGEAIELMVEIAGQLPLVYRMFWAQRWVQVQPDSIPAGINLSRILAADGKLDAAWQKLQEIPDWDRPDQAFQSLATTLALTRKDFETARKHSRRALELDPDNPVLQINFILAHTRGENILEEAEAFALLNQLEANPQTRHQALRARISIYREKLLFSEALESCRQLIRHNPDSLEDRLVLIELLKESGSEGWRSELNELRTRAEASPSPGPMIGIAQWMQKQALAEEVVAWLEASPRTGQDMTLRRILAESRMAAGQWESIIEKTEDVSWGLQDIFRQAILARAYRQLGSDSLGQRHWLRVRRMAQNNVVLGEGLTRYMKNWPRWRAERIELMWMLLDAPLMTPTLLAALEEHYWAKGDAHGLWRTGKVRYQLNPEDTLGANNYAMFCLLLDRNTQEGHSIARRLYQKHPDGHLPISTYSFSLYRQGKPEEALEIFKKLPSYLRKNQIFAGYYGLLLTAAGDPSGEAASLLRHSLRHPVTDVERKLFEAALAKLSQE